MPCLTHCIGLWASGPGGRLVGCRVHTGEQSPVRVGTGRNSTTFDRHRWASLLSRLTGSGHDKETEVTERTALTPSMISPNPNEHIFSVIIRLNHQLNTTQGKIQSFRVQGKITDGDGLHFKMGFE
jgi:hypothetical protein